MTVLTKTTLKMLCVRANLGRTEILEEAQKLLETYEDPNVSPEEREKVRIALEAKIKEIEDRVTTRRLRESRSAGPEPSVP